MTQKNTSKNVLLIFTRNPKLGKVKTRLAKAIGNKKALKIYLLLLEKTKTVTKNIATDKIVYYSEEIIEKDIWDTQTYKKQIQTGTHLGAKMYNAFKNAFKNNYNKVVIIGSDLYDLTPAIITEAFTQLTTNDVVIGPAKDGGYYLLGLKKMHPAIFKNKAWGTDSVRTATLADLKKQTVHLLPLLNDIDIVEDIENYTAFQEFL